MKTARRVLILLLVLVVAIPAAVIALLTTSYANATWQRLSHQLNLPFNADSIHYDFPYHLTLQGVSAATADYPYIEQIDLWMNPDVYRDGQWIVDSLLIDGLSLQQGLPALPSLEHIQFHQVALKNLDYADEQFSANGINLQIQSPRWNGDSIPYGEVQLAADQIYWSGEAFNQVLVDMDYKPENSTLYGASFSWRNSQVSGQGEQYAQGWSLVNVTINKLQMSNAQRDSLLVKPWQTLPFQISHINSLDVLNADIAWGDWHWQNLELSVEDATLPLSLWNTTAQISLQADSVQFQQQTAVEPRLSAMLKPGQLLLNDLSFDWQQGRVQTSGKFSPTQWQIDEASVRGLKWTIQPEDRHDWWRTATSKLDHVAIKRLDIQRSQIIQLSETPYWQLSGFSIDGEQLEIARSNKRWVLWNGHLDASVVNASYEQTLSSHAALSMQSDNGFWQLTRLFAPLEQGYIEGFGHIDLNTTSQPWALNVNADGIPLKLLNRYLPTTFAFEGFTDLSLDLQGLVGDRNMLAYSLSGEVAANMRDTTLKLQADHDLKAVTFSPLRLEAQRGKVAIQPITMSGKTMTGKVLGEFDMTNTPLSGIVYQLDGVCGVVQGDLLSGEVSRNDCVEPPSSVKTDKSRQRSEASMEPTTLIDDINLELHEEQLSEEVVEEEQEPVAPTISAEQVLPTENESATEGTLEPTHLTTEEL
ncbi:AsmA-like protein [Vibrio sp. ES.051]|uniref:AsmA family protein n=1 Tax=Vibrio sp. ES.051 TaxID=1761909 RepID=UPI000BF531AF|nr:AsmA family protein [Vibrio sp. ES.051]PFG45575.1 AsmA-like protein [Vibrio sp. ES.051]